MPTTKRFICIHGHFYQPPRENPWLETVETQDSAAPYHDWNARVTAECYAPNGAARIVNSRNFITRIVNNYARISFNVGPTLLSWMRERAPQAYRTILDGEKRSRRRYNGHSSAMAQVYNHIIMPLASTRDRLTQIRWGIADYEQHYGAKPEGMWLAETAVDAESLELMAQEGIRFTVLAPNQCKRVRALRDLASWNDTPNASVDTTRPYLVRFASGLSIAVFFYNGPVSRAIAFEGLLNSGENFAARLKAGFRDGTQPQLVHVATDGESYGHHHTHGEMALAYALLLLDKDKTVNLTNYGDFLQQFPPEAEAEVVDNSSWSCVHGVERWRSNCGCNGGKAGFNQLWRAPSREALDQLRDQLALLTEEESKPLLLNVWDARDAYINVILDRSPDVVDEFFTKFQNPALGRPMTSDERVRVLEIMEMQRHTQLMYTSCGWFFDDISGIETVQVIAYAGRALQLARELFGEPVDEIERSFIKKLSEAKSNIPGAGDGAEIYKSNVLANTLGLEPIAAHYAISSVFSNYGEETDLFCYRVRRIAHTLTTSGRGKLALGHVEVESLITDKKREFIYAVLHFGDQNITAALKPYDESDAAPFARFSELAIKNVQQADFPEVIRELDRYFGQVNYSLTSLFKDEQHRIVQLILNSTLQNIESALTTIYEDHASLMHYLSLAGLPKPPALALAASFAVNAGMRNILKAEPIDPAVLKSYLDLAEADDVQLDAVTLRYIADERMKQAMLDLQMSAGSIEPLDRALNLARLLLQLPFTQNLWQAQNVWYEIHRGMNYTIAGLSIEDRPRWDAGFSELASCLSIDAKTIKVEDATAETAGD
jgi:alpha-amylase/alpha-mannosidase (GH57 family)